jgi:hypothetical protein
MLVEAQILRDAGQEQNAYKLMEQGVKRFPENMDFLYDFALTAERSARSR